MRNIQVALAGFWGFYCVWGIMMAGIGMVGGDRAGMAASFLEAFLYGVTVLVLLGDGEKD